MKAATNEMNKTGQFLPPDFYANVTLTSVLNGPFFRDLANSNIPLKQRINPPTNWVNITGKVPMHQQSLALTQYSFVGYVILFPDRLRITAPDHELWAFNHLWAVIGYALGIDDEFNVALQPDIKTARAVYKRIYEEFNLPALFHMNKVTKVILENTLKVKFLIIFIGCLIANFKF